MNADPKKVGKRIRSLRQEKGLTTKDFGKFISGASDSLVSRWERGVNLPNNARLKMIAQFGEISVNELLYGKEENYEVKWAWLRLKISEISPGSIDQQLAFAQVLQIMEKIELGGNKHE